MRRIVVTLSCLSAALAGCFEKQLSKEKIEQLAAIAFITWGMEEGTDKFNSKRVDRKILPDGVEYIVPPSKTAGMRMIVKEQSECVFRVQSIGNEQKGEGMIEILDLNKAVNLEFGGTGEKNMFGGYVMAEGPQVYCRGDGDKKCEDMRVFPVLESGSDISNDEFQAILSAMRIV